MAATLLIQTHSTKLLYATILKAMTMWTQIRQRRSMLADMMPDIDTQWNLLNRVLMPCISRKVAIMASLSKDEKVPDETRVPAAVEINVGKVRLMHRLATGLGLTLNTTGYQWFDEDNGFREAAANWAAAAGILIEIEQISADLTMHRAFAADMYTDQTEQRTPGQLTIYNECDVPLADSIFAGAFNRKGLMAGFGGMYLGWMMTSIDDLIAAAPPTIETDQVQVTATPVADPGNPTTQTRYVFAVDAARIAAGWRLGGAVIAAAPDLIAPEKFYTTMIYDSATNGHIRLPGLHSDPTMPATVEIKLLLIRSV